MEYRQFIYACDFIDKLVSCIRFTRAHFNYIFHSPFSSHAWNLYVTILNSLGGDYTVFERVIRPAREDNSQPAADPDFPAEEDKLTRTYNHCKKDLLMSFHSSVSESGRKLSRRQLEKLDRILRKLPLSARRLKEPTFLALRPHQHNLSLAKR